MTSSMPISSSPKTTASCQTLPVVETFHSVQGEGFWTGTSAFFIRLGGCDVGCPWCDTKHSWPMQVHPHFAVEDLVQQAIAAHPAIVVVTGGEPLMHDLTALSQSLRAAGLKVHLETSGSHPFSGSFDWVTFSPKRFKPPHPSIYAQAHELKVVIAKDDDLDWAEQQAAQVADTVIKLLQPEWTQPESQAIACQYVLNHPSWRVSLQTHKFLGVR